MSASMSSNSPSLLNRHVKKIVLAGRWLAELGSSVASSAEYSSTVGDSTHSSKLNVDEVPVVGSSEDCRVSNTEETPVLGVSGDSSFSEVTAAGRSSVRDFDGLKNAMEVERLSLALRTLSACDRAIEPDDGLTSFAAHSCRMSSARLQALWPVVELVRGILESVGCIVAVVGPMARCWDRGWATRPRGSPNPFWRRTFPDAESA